MVSQSVSKNSKKSDLQEISSPDLGISRYIWVSRRRITESRIFFWASTRIHNSSENSRVKKTSLSLGSIQHGRSTSRPMEDMRPSRRSSLQFAVTSIFSWSVGAPHEKKKLQRLFVRWWGHQEVHMSSAPESRTIFRICKRAGKNITVDKVKSNLHI